MCAHVFVIGLDELNLETLKGAKELDDCEFHGLLTIDELQSKGKIDFEALLERASKELRAAPVPVDAIVGYWDFPVSSMVPILCARFGVPSASLESVVKCEHKYWSRREQQKVTDAIPEFALVGLEDERPPAHLNYPIWLKPVKAFGSELAYKATNLVEFQQALAAIRPRIGKIAEPFEYVLSQLELPGDLAEVGAHAVLAEEIIQGQQVTLEGYSHNGRQRIYGVVDSVTYPDSSSFLRYEYPSNLPKDVTDRMSEILCRIVRQLGLDNSPFNAEFFWDPTSDVIKMLEINPRLSQSHARLFAFVDGVPNHACMVRSGLRQTPRMPYREGPYNVAAKWFLRCFADGYVKRVPGREEVARIEQDVPGTTIEVLARLGDRLSEERGQDSYSYQLAHVYAGAKDHAELVEKYETCASNLKFEISEIG